MKLILCDASPAVLGSWRFQFERWPEVEIRTGDVLSTPAGAFLLPGNSFGFLDAGMGLRVCETFGWGVEEELRGRIRGEHEGELLVGQALLLRPAGANRAIVYAPIWRTPRHLSGTIHVFLALRAALLAIRKDTGTPRIESLAVPAMLGEGTGELDPRISARQLRYAWEVATGLRGPGDRNLSQLTRRERKLQSLPEGAEEDRPTGTGELVS